MLLLRRPEMNMLNVKIGTVDCSTSQDTGEMLMAILMFSKSSISIDGTTTPAAVDQHPQMNTLAAKAEIISRALKLIGMKCQSLHICF
jgi:hypothetical protein